MKLGVCYYPEHWPAERWRLDAEMMRSVGISIVRIAEFAWSKMEPQPGEFDWDWLDTSIEALASVGHQIVLCTPTAAPPAWLVQAHPEILPIDEQGRQLRFGSRRHYCPNNLTFHDYTQKIVSAMAARYGAHPAVIGWQIDNEFGCYLTSCYCGTCVSKFQHWLRNKYGDLETLNERWGTVFWSQTYHDWTQIEPPNLTVAEPNPSHVLDHSRFASDSWVEYQQLQIDTLRAKIEQQQFITHNIIASQTTIDYHDLARDLDFICWDSYPTGYAETLNEKLYSADDAPPEYAHDVGDAQITSFFHALTRGLKQMPFWVMEQQTGAINWSKYNTGVRPGALRLWTWQAAAYEAEAVAYFRWRASRFGLEQHHAGLLRHDGEPDTGYRDLQQVKDEYEQLTRFTAQPLKTNIGILLDYGSLWATEMQPHREGFSYLKYLFVVYRACKALGLEADLISQDADWNKYKIILAPGAFLGDSGLANRLIDFANRGGGVMLGVRSGAKDTNNVFTDAPLPGEYRKAVGATVEQWHALPPGINYAVKSEAIELDEKVSFWAEGLRPDAETGVIARYSTGAFRGMAAITENCLGSGKIYYCGFYPKLSQAVELLRFLARGQEIDVSDIPPGLDLIQRGDAFLALNYTETPKTITISGNQYHVAARDISLI